MEKPLYPSPYMRITQGYNEGTHLGSYAIDEAGMDTGIDNLYAPFTGTIKRIYKSDANEIWFESNDKVEYPDGTIDYMTILMTHDNNIDDLYIGKVINKGEIIYQEGKKGNTTGNHCHIECGQGKFFGTGWYKNSSNNWVINNGKNPTECFWIDDNIKILNNHNYQFKRISTPSNINSDKEDEKEDEKTEITPEKKLIYLCEKSDVYAIRLKKGQKLYLE